MFSFLKVKTILGKYKYGWVLLGIGILVLIAFVLYFILFSDKFGLLSDRFAEQTLTPVPALLAESKRDRDILLNAIDYTPLEVVKEEAGDINSIPNELKALLPPDATNIVFKETLLGEERIEGLKITGMSLLPLEQYYSFLIKRKRGFFWQFLEGKRSALAIVAKLVDNKWHVVVSALPDNSQTAIFFEIEARFKQTP